MTARQLQMGDERACAAVVLYRPDPLLLARLAEGLRGTALFALANGPVPADAREALSAADLHWLTVPENLGLGTGLNTVMDAAAQAGFRHVMLLDQDSEPPAGMLETLRARASALADKGLKVALLAPRLVPPAEGFYKPIRYEWRPRADTGGMAAVDFAPTSGSLVSLAAYEAIGPFRDDFFIGGIDVEWGFRAWSRGWASLVATDLEMPHRWGEAASEIEADMPQILRHAPIRNYYYARNVVATARLPHIPWRWRLKSCAALAAQSLLLVTKGAPGALRPLRAGLRDGLAGRLGAAGDDAVQSTRS